MLVYVDPSCKISLPLFFCDLPIDPALALLVALDQFELNVSVVNHSVSNEYFHCHLLVPIPSDDSTLLVPTRLFVTTFASVPPDQTVLEVLNPLINIPRIPLLPYFTPTRTVLNYAIPISRFASQPVVVRNNVEYQLSPYASHIHKSATIPTTSTTRSDLLCTSYLVTSIPADYLTHSLTTDLHLQAQLINLHNHFAKTNFSVRFRPPSLTGNIPSTIRRLSLYYESLKDETMATRPNVRQYYLEASITSACYFIITQTTSNAIIVLPESPSEPPIPDSFRIVSTTTPVQPDLSVLTPTRVRAYHDIELSLINSHSSNFDSIYDLVKDTPSNDDLETSSIVPDLIPIIYNNDTLTTRPGFAITFQHVTREFQYLLSSDLITTLSSGTRTSYNDYRYTDAADLTPLENTINQIVASTLSYHLPHEILKYLSSCTHRCIIGLFCPMNAILCLSPSLEFSEYLLLLNHRFPIPAPSTPLSPETQSLPNTVLPALDPRLIPFLDVPSAPTDLITMTPPIVLPSHNFYEVEDPDSDSSSESTNPESPPFISLIFNLLRLRASYNNIDGTETLTFTLSANQSILTDMPRSPVAFFAAILFMCLKFAYSMLPH